MCGHLSTVAGAYKIYPTSLHVISGTMQAFPLAFSQKSEQPPARGAVEPFYCVVDSNWCHKSMNCRDYYCASLAKETESENKTMEDLSV